MPDQADAVLLAAVDLAREALLEITPADTVGEPIGHIIEGEHVLSLLFECTMTGYPGWRWTVSLSRVDGDAEPSVLETELTPGDDALVAPDWIPWSDRLADYRTAQELAAAVAAAEALDSDVADDDDDDDADDDDDDDADDDDDDDVDDDDDADDDESDYDDESNDDDSDDDADEDLDDDRGEDELDGIDFGEALAAPVGHPGESEKAQNEADGGAGRPPAKSRRRKVSAKDQGEHQG